MLNITVMSRSGKSNAPKTPQCCSSPLRISATGNTRTSTVSNGFVCLLKLNAFCRISASLNNFDDAIKIRGKKVQYNVKVIVKHLTQQGPSISIDFSQATNLHKLINDTAYELNIGGLDLYLIFQGQTINFFQKDLGKNLKDVGIVNGSTLFYVIKEYSGPIQVAVHKLAPGTCVIACDTSTMLDKFISLVADKLGVNADDMVLSYGGKDLYIGPFQGNQPIRELGICQGSTIFQIGRR